MNKVRFLTAAVFYGLFFVSGLGATTYHISTEAGAADANSGVAASPWRTIAAANAFDFAPGDSLLFQAGETFFGQLYLSGEDGGTAAAPLTIGSFGGGKATIQTSNATEDAIFTFNVAGIAVVDLILRGQGTAGTSKGIEFFSNVLGNVRLDFVSISGVEASNFSEGIVVSSFVAGETTGYDNITITDCYVHDVSHTGISIFGTQGLPTGNYSHHNVYVADNLVHDITGFTNYSVNHTGNGILLAEVDGAVVERNVAHDGGMNNIMCGGPVAIWAYDCNAVIFQFNEAYNWENGSGCDGGGFDLDGGMSNSILQYNYSHDNEGPAYLAGNYIGARDHFGNVIRYNISENDCINYGSPISVFTEFNSSISDRPT